MAPTQESEPKHFTVFVRVEKNTEINLLASDTFIGCVACQQGGFVIKANDVPKNRCDLVCVCLCVCLLRFPFLTYYNH